MAHFRGTVFNPHKSNATTASRLGHTGLYTEAQSWEGKVVVALNRTDTRDMARVSFGRHHGKGTEFPLYHGPIAPADIQEASRHLYPGLRKHSARDFLEYAKARYVEGAQSDWAMLAQLAQMVADWEG